MELKTVYVSKEEVADVLSADATEGKRLLEPLLSRSSASRMPFNILEDSGVWNDAEVHTEEDDVWYCLEGQADFVYGGEMVNPWFRKRADGTEDAREIKAKEIRGGTRVTLSPGDWLWIPAGEPHQHGAKGTARLAIIKIPRSSV